MASQVAQTISNITDIMKIHLNIGQNMTMRSTAGFMSLETAMIGLLPNKLIELDENAQISMPRISNLNDNTSVLLRVSEFSNLLNKSSCLLVQLTMQPLASSDVSKFEANTGLSRSVSISLLDENGNDIHIDTTVNQPIEILIPRDPNMGIPPMQRQNVTSIKGNQRFYLQQIDLKPFLNDRNLTPSLHFEIQPLDIHLGYLFIYEFDNVSQLNMSINETDDWSLLCPYSKFL